MNADGTAVRRLTRTRALESTPVWSPDGTQIAFTSDRHKKRGKRERNSRDFELYVMCADGSAIRRITRNRVADMNPDWQALGSFSSGSRSLHPRMAVSTERLPSQDLLPAGAEPLSSRSLASSAAPASGATASVSIGR